MTVSPTNRQRDWQRDWQWLRRDIDPRLRWVRDDERLYVVIPQHGQCVELSGAEALLFELWVDEVASNRRWTSCVAVMA